MTKVALITTTIRVPEVLALLHAHDLNQQLPVPTPPVRFFIAGDRQTPHVVVQEFLAAHNIPAGSYIHPDEQTKRKCSAAIGWNCIQRRNIALLEALKWGADIIIAWDDDNASMDRGYFHDFRTTLLNPFSGLVADPATWFNPLCALSPPTRHRGFPLERLESCFSVTHAVNARVGVAAGVVLGDTDVSAVDRLAHRSQATDASAILRAGVAFKPEHRSWTVFNTQNTAFLRELAPAMFCPPAIGRHDDIVASLVTQRVMRERGLYVHFGKPFCWQQRNHHDLVRDLEQEWWGYRHIAAVADILDGLDFSSMDWSTIEMVRNMYLGFGARPWFPAQSIDAAMAWCEDVESVL